MSDELRKILSETKVCAKCHTMDSRGHCQCEPGPTMTTSPKAGMPEVIWADDRNANSLIAPKIEYVLASRLHAAEKVIEVARGALERRHGWATEEAAEADRNGALRVITAYRESKHE